MLFVVFRLRRYEIVGVLIVVSVVMCMRMSVFRLRFEVLIELVVIFVSRLRIGVLLI